MGFFDLRTKKKLDKVGVNKYSNNKIYLPEKLDHDIFVFLVAPRNTTIHRESWKQFDCLD
jgi:hypothetical protein